MSEDWGLVTLPTSGDPEKIAIGRLKAASDMALKYYGTPLVVTTSGGKDSSVCVELALRGASRLKYSTTTQLRMRRRQCGLYGGSLPDLKIWA